MPSSTPHALWKILEDQAAEDRADGEELAAVAALRDEELDAELAAAGIDVGEVEGQARALGEPAGATVAVAVAQDAPSAARQPRASRRRPVALWLAAAAATATVGAGVLYATRDEAPGRLPPSPAPTPSTPAPLPPAPPERIAAAELRTRAAAALDTGDPAGAIALLDRARAMDPQGDAAPATTALRARARAALPDGARKPR